MKTVRDFSQIEVLGTKFLLGNIPVESLVSLILFGLNKG